MTTQMSLNERIDQREKERQEHKGGIFLKWVNDLDMRLVRVIIPYEGYLRTVVNKQNNTSKVKMHFRAHFLGGLNSKGDPIDGFNPNYTADEIRNLEPEEAKIFTAPETIEVGIHEGVKNHNSIFLIVRHGKAQSTSTTYQVYSVDRITPKELETIAPKLSKEDIVKLDNEVNYEEMLSDEEISALVNAGKETNSS